MDCVSKMQMRPPSLSEDSMTRINKTSQSLPPPFGMQLSISFSASLPTNSRIRASTRRSLPPSSSIHRPSSFHRPLPPAPSDGISASAHLAARNPAPLLLPNLSHTHPATSTFTRHHPHSSLHPSPIFLFRQTPPRHASLTPFPQQPTPRPPPQQQRPSLPPPHYPHPPPRPHLQALQQPPPQQQHPPHHPPSQPHPLLSLPFTTHAPPSSPLPSNSPAPLLPHRHPFPTTPPHTRFPGPPHPQQRPLRSQLPPLHHTKPTHPYPHAHHPHPRLPMPAFSFASSLMVSVLTSPASCYSLPCGDAAAPRS